MMLPVLLLAGVPGEAADEEERRLIEKARQGDREAFGEIVKRYQKRVFRVARRMTRSDDDAWDLTQEAFIRAMNAMPGFDPRYRFFTWIYRIVTNLSINLTRKRERASEVRYEEEYGADGQLASCEDHSGRLHAAELADAIENAVSRLSPPLRAVFVLRVDQQLSYAEIAETLGIAMGTVMSRLNRAREKVRDSVSHLIEESP
ncbi:sigma-70 family RNA polymerase sigma factor [Candidatus Fermentibacterales bacterium]|nr:sigma-70 family RNA polymerase sigma factor [Candidatus Fermentibacterales bacterium]